MQRRLLAALDVLDGSIRTGYPKRRQLIVELSRYLITYWRLEVEFMAQDEPVLPIPLELVELCHTLLACPNEFVLPQQQLVESAVYSRMGVLLGRWAGWEILIEKERERAERGLFMEGQVSVARASVSFQEEENSCTKNYLFTTEGKFHDVSRTSEAVLIFDQTNEAHIIEKKEPMADLPDISTLAKSPVAQGAPKVAASLSPRTPVTMNFSTLNLKDGPSVKSQATTSPTPAAAAAAALSFSSSSSSSSSASCSPTAATSVSNSYDPPSSPVSCSEHDGTRERSSTRSHENTASWHAAVKLFKDGWWRGLSFDPVDLPRTPITIPTPQDDDILYHGDQDPYAVGTVNRILLFCDSLLRVAGDLNEWDLKLMLRHANCLLLWANWQHEGLHDISDNEAHLEVYTIYRRTAILLWNALYGPLKLMDPLRRSTARDIDPPAKKASARPEDFKSELTPAEAKEAMSTWANAVDGMVSVRRLCRAVDNRDPAERKLSSLVFHYIHAFRSIAQKDVYQNLDISLRPIIALSLAQDDDVGRLAWQLLHELSLSGKGELKAHAERNVAFMADLQRTSVSDEQNWCRAKLSELPSDIKKMLVKSEVPQEELIQHWDLLRNILYFDVGFRLPVPFQKPIDRAAMSAKRRRATEARVLARKLEHASIAMNDSMFRSMLIQRDPKEDYVKWEIVGHGGFGEVFSANRKGKEMTLGGKAEPDVAIKCIRCNNDSDFALVKREILALGVCRHNNLVKLISAYDYDSCLWVVMEFCNGGSLREFLTSNNMKEPEIAYVAAEILKGLEYLADHDKIHRDLKPDNILLHISGDVTIADLGLLVDFAREKLKTSMAGTPFYIAPEMIRNESYDSKLDIWSFGCIVLEMANTTPPHQKEHIIKCLLGTATQPPPKLKSESKWSPELKTFLEACLNRDPAKRQSASQLLKHPFLSKASDKEAIKAQFRHVFTARALKAAGLC